VVGDLESVTLGHGVLPSLDILVHELFDMPAVDALDVVVVRALVEFEHCHAVGEMVAGHEACGLELRQHAVDGRKTNIFARVDQTSIDVFS